MAPGQCWPPPWRKPPARSPTRRPGWPTGPTGRTSGDGFNALAYAGLRDNAPALQDLLGPSSQQTALGLVTQAPVADALARAATGQPTARGALHLVVAAAEVWLRPLTATSTTWWEEVGGRVAVA